LKPFRLQSSVQDEQRVASAATQPALAPSAPQADVDHIFTPGRLALLIGLLMLILFPEVIVGSHAFFYRDAGLFGYPVAYYIKNSFWHGEIPLWNPYSNCGIPFLAQWNTMVLYPGSLIYVLFPMPWSMNAFLLAHIFFAAIGMYLLAHRLFNSHFGAAVAGLAFGWNGLTLQCIMWPCNLAALAWMPWVILLAERAWKRGDRAIVWAALAGACQMLTGSPEFTLFTWLIVFGWFAVAQWQRKRWCWMETLVICGCAMLVAALSAAQLLPTLDLLQQGDRTTASSDSTWSMPFWGVANFLVPLFRCTPSVAGVWSQDQQQWTPSYYVGVVTLLLAAFGVFKIRQFKTTLLAFVAVVGVVFAMGDAALVLKFLKATVPILGFIRYPIKYIALTVFALPLLAAAGAGSLHRLRFSERKPVLVTAGLIAAAIVGLPLCGSVVADDAKGNCLRSAMWQNAEARLLFLVIATVAMIASLELRKKTATIACAVLLLLVMGVDVCIHMPTQNPTVVTFAYERRPPQMRSIPKLGESRAMITRDVQGLMENSAHPYPLNMYMGQRAELFANCNLLDCGTTNATDYACIPKVNGFYSLHLRDQWAVTKVLYGEQFPTPLAQFVGVSQLTSYEHLFAWNQVTNYMPMATIGQQPVFVNEPIALELLGTFNPQETVLLPDPLHDSISSIRDADARVVRQSIGTHEHRYDVVATKRTVFVVAQTYYKNWKAFVDGKPVPLLRVNVAFQAIEIPEGKHQVRLVYRDTKFYIGAVISGISLLLCAGLLMRRPAVTQ
jgi:uncharacterized membrane protein YfhO